MFTMSAGDKVNNAAQNLSGKIKEVVGKATDNERLEGRRCIERWQDRGRLDR
jgi:uncharacterized protein YjbJ (UPF0337 family)